MRLEVVEAVHHQHLRGEALLRRRHRAAERGQVQMLGQALWPAGIVDQFGLFLAAQPVRHLGRLQRDLETGSLERRADLGHRGLGLRRTAQARTDLVGEVGQALPGPVAGQGGVADLRQHRGIDRRGLELGRPRRHHGQAGQQEQGATAETRNVHRKPRKLGSREFSAWAGACKATVMHGFHEATACKFMTGGTRAPGPAVR